VGKIIVIYAQFLLDVACQKLLKSANISRSYSKYKSDQPKDSWSTTRRRDTLALACYQ